MVRALNLSIGDKLKTAAYFILIIVAGFVLPLVLIFIAHYTGFSEIFEEIAKALVILFLILKLPKLKWQIFATIIFGFLFGLSESIFYLNNIFQIGDFSIFWWRFLTAVPMHIVTSLIILFFAQKNKKFIIVGTIIVIVLHLLFNQVINIFL